MKQKEYRRRGIIYYIKVWLKIFKLSFSKTHTYKTEVFANIIRIFVTVIPQVIATYSLYGGRSEYAGWKIEESFLILGIFNLVNYTGWSFFSINLGRLDEKIEKGEWDLLLLKPISSVFSAAFVDFFLYNLVLAFSGIIFVLFYLIKTSFVFSPEIFLKALIVLFSSMVVWFSLSLIAASFSFLKTHMGIIDITKQVMNISRFPINTWPNVVQILFYTVIPIAFISTVPAKVITGSMSWEAVGISIIVSVVFLWISKLIWENNVSKYSSTGS
jgi:ABC-2 type transport system permease protein